MLMQVFSINGAVHSSLKLHYLFTSRTGLLLITGAAFSRSAAAGYADPLRSLISDSAGIY